MLLLNMVQILLGYMKCSWDHWGRLTLMNSAKIFWLLHISFIFFFGLGFTSYTNSSLYFFTKICACRDSKTWNTSGIDGVYRFLGRSWRLIVGLPLPNGTFQDGTIVTDDEPTLEQLRPLHKCINKVMTINRFTCCCYIVL